MGLWDNLLKEYDEIVHIPMSSGLSASCDTATMLARDYDGRVQVVNNQRISVTQRQSVLDAIALRDAGKNAAEIKEKLEEEKMESSIYITLETLKYLKKGGRITPAAAALGTLLRIKPVLTIQGEKLDAYKKVRGVKAAKKNMLEAMKNGKHVVTANKAAVGLQGCGAAVDKGLKLLDGHLHRGDVWQTSQALLERLPVKPPGSRLV